MDGVTAIAISHNGRFFVTGGMLGEVRLWDIRSREMVSHLKEHVGKVTNVKLTDDDCYAISVSRDRCALRWDLKAEVRLFLS